MVGFTFYKGRQLLFGSPSPWDSSFLAQRLPLPAFLLFVVAPVATPWLLLLNLVVPLPFDLMPEPPSPWYVPYTTIWDSISIYTFLPASYLGAAAFGEPNGLLSWVLRSSWAALLSLTIFRVTRAIRPLSAPSA